MKQNKKSIVIKFSTNLSTLGFYSEFIQQKNIRL